MNQQHRPALERLYLAYLDSEDTAAFVQAVAERYLLTTLARLAGGGDHVSRRAAIMAVGFLGDFSHNAILGRAMSDVDRGVRLLADSGIRQLWRRDGSRGQQATLARICRLNQNEQYAEAHCAATGLIEDAPAFAEAWNQRAVSSFAQRQFDDAAHDCQQTLELNPFHFGAAVGSAHCCLHQDDPVNALEYFRRALAINPDLEDVRGQIELLARTLEGK